MATKGVLGNDPFQRGAAQRSTESESGSGREPGEAPAPRQEKAASGKAAKDGKAL